jgi:hypothetical protein
MPIAPGDGATTVFGIWPFGVHGGDHALDGHPGWDVEFRPGATLRAPADGVVANVIATGSTVTLAIDHVQGRFRTDYTNVASLAPGIATGAAVTRGQVLGTPATITAFIGTRLLTYAMVHFQFDDFTHNEGSTNPFAMNPLTALNASGRALFDTLWQTASYTAELVEPFAGNPRDVVFPLTRTWSLERGGLAARLEITRPSPNSLDFRYVMRDGSGTVIEEGTADGDANLRPATIDFRSNAGTVRRGLWDVVDDRMTLDYSTPGGQRPSGLGAASTYRTQRPAAQVWRSR